MASLRRDQEGRIIGPYGQSQWQLLLPFTGHFRLLFAQAELRSLKPFFLFHEVVKEMEALILM